MNDNELARNYILDRLPEEVRDECERRFLFDPEFETVMIEQENALLDDYVNLRLTEEEAQTVLHRVAQEPGHLYRLRFAESLRRAAMAAAETQARKPPRLDRWLSLFPQRQSAWFGRTAGVAAIAIVLLVAIAVQHRRAPHPPPLAAASAPASAPLPQTANPPAPALPSRQNSRPPTASMATFVLLANQQRGETEEAAITLKPGTATLRLQLTTEEGLAPGPYSAKVSNAQGATVFAASHLPSRTEAGRRYIDLRLAAAPLSTGDYTVDLTGEAPSSIQPALSYRFTLAVPHSAADAAK
jgi:hypothetical protein